MTNDFCFSVLKEQNPFYYKEDVLSLQWQGVQAEDTAGAWLSQALVKPPVPAAVLTRSLSSSHHQQLQGPDLWQATNKGVFKN